MLPVTDATNTPEPIPHPAPYADRFVSVAGLRLHYLDYGTATHPPMLCIHGGAAHAHWYDFIANRFTPDYHVRALDLRGHGDSDWGDPHGYNYQRYADDVFETVDRLDLQDFVLMGHSMGGLVSLLYAATHPERVKKLVIVDTALNMTEERVASMRTAGTREGRSYATHEEFQTRFRLQPPNSTASPEIVAHIAWHSGREHPDRMWRHKVDRNVQARRAGMNGIPLWGHIRVPALLVKGALSDRITPEVLNEVRGYCPHVRYVEVPDAEHHVTLDNPAGLVQAVSEFLASR